MSSLAEVEPQAVSLPPAERARLTDGLLESLQDSSSAEVEEAWAKEIAQRVAGYEAGRMIAVPAEEVFAEARRRIR